MVFNASFNIISIILWRSVLLVEETIVNHRPVATHWQTVSHNVVSNTPRLYNYHTLTTTTTFIVDQAKYEHTERNIQKVEIHCAIGQSQQSSKHMHEARISIIHTVDYFLELTKNIVSTLGCSNTHNNTLQIIQRTIEPRFDLQ